MHAFYHNQDGLSTENVLQEKKGIEPHISKKKLQLTYPSSILLYGF